MCVQSQKKALQHYREYLWNASLGKESREEGNACLKAIRSWAR